MDKPYGYVRADGKGVFIFGEHQFTNNQNHDLIPVYTHQKEWVGLTDEEFEQLLVDAKFTRSDLLMVGACVEDICNMVEAKLKEKNGA